ncbi:deoxyribodipyrimidine photo-lyase [Rhizobiales bacterium]|uniref:cryptochrome/photolyase family protein n=1 Tax=Hongsoonwoonella zoysiae TaxID=2821844 RepID=UPI001561A771|nr:deoxyribodipyrimidine photo-lyase [Hongsoonwoonella zoysiae]NRG19055.1 deoxyribodipyrimidine photo-lyase [Hongsoonwoonella zoysiae]
MSSSQFDGVTIVWFRDDLRITDNPTLERAVEIGRPALACFIFEADDPTLERYGGAAKWWLHHSLTRLNETLADLGIALVLREGKAAAELTQIAEETGASTVLWNRRYDPAGIKTDKVIKSGLKERGIAVESFNANLLVEPWEIETSSGGPFRVYTPFWRALRQRGEPPAPTPAVKGLTGVDRPPQSLAIDDLSLLPRKPDWAEGLREIWTPGEAGAQARLRDFLENALERYATERDLPGASATSMLSPHLRFGEISPRQIWHAACHHVAKEKLADKPLEKFLSELAWREFSYHLLFHFPSLPSENYQAKFDGFPWEDDSTAFRAWSMGRTGYPIVDAGMRELWHTGYLHNRVRMVVASFLIKHLMIDWREGAAWFRDTLVDADIANNSASWQWVAGSGADAAPYFRIFNPITQGEKFDADGTYTRRWVPELADLPNEYLFRPFDAPQDVLEKAGVELGKTYPHPLVDHSKARVRALDAFQSLSSAA